MIRESTLQRFLLTVLIGFILISLAVNPHHHDNRVSASSSLQGTVEPIPTNQFGVIEVRPLTIPYKFEIDEKDSAYLSPDGSRILVASAMQLCVFLTDSETEESCVYANMGDTPTTFDITESPRWSPDSHRIVFTEDFSGQLKDPDIWIMEAATGVLTNLTNDSVEQQDSDGSWPNIDIEPRWSHDGQRISFIRCEAPCNLKNSVAFYSISASGGEPERIATTPFTIFQITSLVVLQDSYLYSVFKREDAASGIWRATSDTQHLQQLVHMENIQNLEISADSRYVLAYSPLDEMERVLHTRSWLDLRDKVAEKSWHRVIALEGESKALSIHDEFSELWPGWSPDGAQLIYGVSHPMYPSVNGLHLLDNDNGSRELVYGATGLQVAPALWRGYVWAGNNTVLIFERGSLTLLHLDPR